MKNYVLIGKDYFDQNVLKAIVNFQFDSQQFNWNHFNDQFSIAKSPQWFLSHVPADFDLLLWAKKKPQGQFSKDLLLNIQYCPICEAGCWQKLIATIDSQWDQNQILTKLKQDCRDYQLEAIDYQNLNQAMISHQSECFYQKYWQKLEQKANQVEQARIDLKQWTKKAPEAITKTISDEQFQNALNYYWIAKWSYDYHLQLFNDVGKVVANYVWNDHMDNIDQNYWNKAIKSFNAKVDYQNQHPIIALVKIFAHHDDDYYPYHYYPDPVELKLVNQKTQQWAMQFNHQQWNAIKTLSANLVVNDEQTIYEQVLKWIDDYDYQSEFKNRPQRVGLLVATLTKISQGDYDQVIKISKKRTWFKKGF